MLVGLETLPVLEVPYGGVTLREFSLDGALARRPALLLVDALAHPASPRDDARAGALAPPPALLLVDALAHTNAPGSRHPRRWQDVEELLAAGIDVWTTLNVQHIESLNDVIAQITGVAVKETLPDAVLERADEIELVDITP